MFKKFLLFFRLKIDLGRLLNLPKSNWAIKGDCDFGLDHESNNPFFFSSFSYLLFLTQSHWHSLTPKNPRFRINRFVIVGFVRRAAATSAAEQRV